MADLGAVMADARTLSPADQQQLRSSLPPPGTPQGLNNVWYILIIGLLILALAGLGAAVYLITKDKAADAAWAIVTAVIGGLVGLLAPSPAQTNAG